MLDNQTITKWACEARRRGYAAPNGSEIDHYLELVSTAASLGVRAREIVPSYDPRERDDEWLTARGLRNEITSIIVRCQNAGHDLLAACQRTHEASDPSSGPVDVIELPGTTRRNAEDGGTDRVDRYQVTRHGKSPHVVSITKSWDSGTPQSEHCDCRGFKFHRDCCHVRAVYESGLMCLEID